MSHRYDAVVVGSGPNGLSAAIVLAQAGLSVLVLEERNTVGGGMRSAELTLPGFVHDICSAIYPLGVGSPFFKTLPLEKFGLEWVHPQVPAAHPFDKGPAALLERSIEMTGSTLGNDAASYRDLFEPLVNNWDKLSGDLLAPLKFPSHPLVMAQFGFLAIRSAFSLAQSKFQGELARGLFAGAAAHAIMPLTWHITAAVGLILATAGHAVGWPLVKGGSQKFADALAAYFRSIGGEIVTGIKIDRMCDLPPTRMQFFDTSPKELLRIAKDELPDSFKRKLKKYRFGPGAFKVDWALDGPIPWRAKECARGGTVHIGGTIEEIAHSEKQVWEGKIAERPFVLLAQQSLFDPSRAPPGKHTAWAYCHVPNGCAEDVTEKIEAQIERFAPGFKDCILAKSIMAPKNFEKYNPNYVGGDIIGGVQDIYQLFTRPTARLVPYSTPVKGLYICSSSTPPGGGVHGMCGYFAAKAALKNYF